MNALIALKGLPRTSADEMFEIFSKKADKWFGSELSVLNIHPLEINMVKQTEQTEEEALIIKELLSRFIIRVLRNVLGIEYVLANHRIHMDNRAISLSFSMDHGKNPPHKTLTD